MRSNLKTALFLFIFFFSIYSLFMSGHLYSPDEEIMYRTTESLGKSHTLAIQPLADEGDRFTDKDSQGRFYGHYGIGQSLWALPFWGAGQIISPFFPDQGLYAFRPSTAIAYHGHTPQEYWNRYFVSRMGQVTTALACVMIFLIALQLGYSSKNGFLISLFYGLGTMAFPFSKTFYSEPTVTLFLLLAFYHLCRFQNSNLRKHLMIAGCWVGAALLTRVDTIILIPSFILYLLYPVLTAPSDKSKWKNFWSNALVSGIPLIIAGLLVALYNFIRFGSPTYTGYESEGLTFSFSMWDGLYGLLLSSGRGVVIYSPLVLLFFPAIKHFWQEHKQQALLCILIILSYVLFYSKWESWAGGWTWGPRHIYQIHAFLIIPVLALLKQQDKRFNMFFWIPLGLLALGSLYIQIPALLVSFMDYHFYYQSIGPLHEILYIPVRSPLAGHWAILTDKTADLFYYQLWKTPVSIGLKLGFLIYLIGLAVSSGYLYSRIFSKKAPVAGDEGMR